jgi:hypothetical protein
VIATVEQGAEGEDDDGRNLTIRLSTDVLFATNKSDLNAAAQNKLRTVAARIDKSRGTVVRVDGHTDNTGNDAINNPLSQRRAEAVKGTLQGLVTRGGVTFQAQGHGSKQPVATNRNDAGRHKNRRVTVSFERPAPTPSATPSGAQRQRAFESWPRPVVARTTPSSEPRWRPLDGWPKGLTVEINSITRDATGFGTATFTIVNPDDSVRYTTNSLADVGDGMFHGSSMSGVSLVSGDRRVRVLRASDRQLVGSADFGIFLGFRFSAEPNSRLTVWSTFKIPLDMTSVDVHIQGFNPVRDVPIQ